MHRRLPTNVLLLGVALYFQASGGGLACSGGSANPGSAGTTAVAGDSTAGSTDTGGRAGSANTGGAAGDTSVGESGPSSAGGDGTAGTSGTPQGGTGGGSGAPSGAGVSGAAGGSGGVAAAGSAGASGSAGTAALALNKDAEGLLSKAGLTIVSYGGYLNGESFQEDGVVSFKGYQYAAFWNSARHVVLSRRSLPSGAWSSIEFTDYTNSEGDAHNTISIGLCPGDGTLHLSFDHHVSTLHYRSSVAGFASDPSNATWAASSFSAVSSHLVGSTSVTQVTYPRFITEPGGTKMLFQARLGSSGSGDEYLWEYDGASHAWSSIGRYIYGTGDSINAYPHGVSYEPGGKRLHVSWCWRETADAASNHDLLYVYSDDNGRTWKNSAGTSIGTTGTTPITKSSAGIKVWTINQNRGLINQEYMLVDAQRRVHVLLSHMPDAQADDSVFDSARKKSQYFHYLRDESGTWARSALNLSAVASFRGKLAVASSGNLYAVLPDLRIAGSAAVSKYIAWTLLDSKDSGRFFSDPLIDSSRLLSEDKLSIVYPQQGSANIYVLDYTIR